MSRADANGIAPPETPSAPSYPRSTRLAALAVLACGWALPTVLRAQLTSTIVEVMIGVMLLLPAVAVGVLTRSLPRDERTNHLEYAFVPCLGASTFVALLGVPAFELVRPLSGAMVDVWQGVFGVMWSLYFAVMLYGPQQFLWRSAAYHWRALAVVVSTAPPLVVALPFELPSTTLDVIVTSVGTLAIAGVGAWIAESMRSAMSWGQGTCRRPSRCEHQPRCLARFPP